MFWSSVWFAVSYFLLSTPTAELHFDGKYWCNHPLDVAYFFELGQLASSIKPCERNMGLGAMALNIYDLSSRKSIPIFSC